MTATEIFFLPLRRGDGARCGAAFAAMSQVLVRTWIAILFNKAINHFCIQRTIQFYWSGDP